MKKLVAVLCVAAAIALATVLALHSDSPPKQEPHPKLDGLIVQCDAQGSSLAVAYDKVSARLPDLIGSDRATALAVTRGQVANVIAGRLATCEQALAIAQHDQRGSAVMIVGPFTRRLEVAATMLRQLDLALAGSDDARAALDDLTAAVHAAVGR